MTNRLNELTETQRWHLLVSAAKDALESKGYTLSRVPGRGLSNIWNVEKGGKSQVAAIRTTRDRWIAFPPLENGTKWKTLDDVDLVVVAAVDAKDNPQNIEVYVFPQADVRKRFDDAYAARTKAGQVNKDNYGMWVGLDKDKRGIAASVGSGIVEHYKRIADFSVDALLSAVEMSDAETLRDTVVDDRSEVSNDLPATIAEVMEMARQRVAEIAGVRSDAVKLDLKIEY